MKPDDACYCLAIVLRARQHLSDSRVLAAFDAHLRGILALRRARFVVGLISGSKTLVTSPESCRQRSLLIERCDSDSSCGFETRTSSHVCSLLILASDIQITSPCELAPRSRDRGRDTTNVPAARRAISSKKAVVPVRALAFVMYNTNYSSQPCPQTSFLCGKDCHLNRIRIRFEKFTMLSNSSLRDWRKIHGKRSPRHSR